MESDHAPPPLLHMAWECPGMSGRGTRMTIVPRKFGALFAPGQPRITIPLFQRTYCWSETETQRWLNDARGVKRPEQHDICGRHPTGKAIFVRHNEGGGASTRAASPAAGAVDTRPLLCIDGQQRCTSMQLLIAALRDAALRARCALRGVSAPPATNPAIAAARIDASGLIDTLDGLLFRDVPAARAWAEAAVHDAAVRCSVAPGEAPPMATTFLPSFVDRAPFFELIVGGLLHNVRAENDLTGGTLDGAAPHPVSDATERSCMGRAKRCFDAGLAAVCEREIGATVGSSREEAALRELEVQLGGAPEAAPALDASTVARRRVSWLRATATTVLRRMSLMYVETLSPISVAQVFLWLQEKSLVGSSLIHNPHPGQKFKATDLVRNLLLYVLSMLYARVACIPRCSPLTCIVSHVLCRYPTMHLSLHEQERRHKLMWLDPIERTLGGAANVDLCINDFLYSFEAARDAAEEEADWAAGHPGRGGGGRGARATAQRVCANHLSSMERALTGGRRLMRGELSTGPLLYARFVSHVEGREVGKGARVEEGGGVAITARTCDEVLTDLRAFVDAGWRPST